MAHQSLSLILHDVRSAYNVGSVFRTADAAGADTLYLTGHTPAPIDRFGRWRRDIAKVALGAERSVSWKREEDIVKLLKILRAKGQRVVAVEQTKRAKNYKAFVPTRPTVFVFGNEVAGLTDDVLALCDESIEIPMHGSKESLNVSVAAGIILFHYVV